MFFVGADGDPPDVPAIRRDDCHRPLRMAAYILQPPLFSRSGQTTAFVIQYSHEKEKDR